MTDQSAHLHSSSPSGRASGRRPASVPSAVRSAVAAMLLRVSGRHGSPLKAQRHLGADDELPSGEGWIEWTGGPCPVDQSLVVEVVRWSSAGFVHQFGEAGTIGWRWANGHRLSIRAGNVLAFRVADVLNNQAYAEAIRLAIKDIGQSGGGEQDLDLDKLKAVALGYLN